MNILYRAKRTGSITSCATATFRCLFSPGNVSFSSLLTLFAYINTFKLNLFLSSPALPLTLSLSLALPPLSPKFSLFLSPSFPPLSLSLSYGKKVAVTAVNYSLAVETLLVYTNIIEK